jgi:hypothetical protein
MADQSIIRVTREVFEMKKNGDLCEYIGT